MGCVSSRISPIEEESTDDMPSRTQISTTAYTNDSLWALVNDGAFQAHVSERTFQIFLHEDLPDYWKLQLDLLVVLKFIFDRIKPRGATVIFPNRPLRYPTGDTEALLRLTGIKTLHEGVQLWTEYLVQTGSLHIGESNWHTAFRQTREGYRFNLVPTEGAIHCRDHGMLAQELRPSQHRRSATEEMTATIEDAYSCYSSVHESSNEALKDRISQKARDLLPRYMEPVPLGFAVHNYDNLMQTSYDAGTGIALTNVALQALTDVKESPRGGLGSRISIIVVKGTIPQAHISLLSEASIEVRKVISKDKSSKSRGNLSHGVCFASLPDTGVGSVWRKLSYRSEGNGGFCNYVELPASISPHVVPGKFVRKMLLGSVDSTTE
ncbi:hypothetical protein J4E91_011153 [Alternaria rosae]|nr:hypothetical protein J4E91_011153 [Alternaria rosae]